MNHFARILPIVGTALFEKRVAVVGFPAAVPVVRYLAANGVRRWIWRSNEKLILEMLTNELMAQHGGALRLEASAYSLPTQGADVVLAVGNEAWAEGEQLAAKWRVPLLTAPTLTGWEWACAAPLIALQLRQYLLGQPAFELPPTLSTSFTLPPKHRHRLLIAGLGSLGSIAALHLAPYVNSLVIADPDMVDTYNPVRQAYPHSTIGQNKAEALATLLRAQGVEVIALPYALTDEEDVTALAAEYHIDGALITTGTHHDYTIARGLHAAQIPHVAGRCYPRARYWEGIVVEAGLPSFEEMRGHLYVGPAPAPTPEQQRAYSDAGALEAETATLIESGWAAAWLARLTWQITLPPALRDLWFLQQMAARQSCFIGGLHVEETESGVAYGISAVGQIRGYARQEIRADKAVMS